MHEVIKDVVKLSELLKEGYGWYSFAKSHEKEQFIRIIFSELFINENTLTYKVTKGFKSLESRFNAVGELIGSRTQ